MQPFVCLQKTRQIHGEKTTNKNQATATTRKSPGQICVSPAEEKGNQHKKGPETPKKPTQNHQDCLRHDRDKLTVSPKHAQRISKSMVQTNEKPVKSYALFFRPTPYGSRQVVERTPVACLQIHRINAVARVKSCATVKSS